MTRRQAVQVGAFVWAVVGAAVAIPQIASANSDARLLVGVASVLGPAAAVGAAMLLGRGGGRGRGRWAGALLLVSVATPTYFAWMLNVPALIAGLVLLLAPSAVLTGRPADAVAGRGRASG